MASNKPCLKGTYLEYRVKNVRDMGKCHLTFWKGKSILCNIGVSKWRIFWKPSSNKNTNFFLFLFSYFFLFTANKNTIWLVPCVCPLNHPAGHLFHLDLSSSCFLFLISFYLLQILYLKILFPILLLEIKSKLISSLCVAT